MKQLPSEDIDGVLSSIISVYYLIKESDEAKDASQSLRLQICKKCLQSQALALRVFSIIEINKLIDDTKRMKSNEAARKEAIRELIEWMKENSVFDLLWNSSRTHE